MHFLPLLLSFFAFPALILAGGTITSPANGTVILPGQSFAFSYDPMADYSMSTYNYTVFLLTKPPASLYPSNEWSSGHYFGRFDYPNYPAVPYPTHPAPANLTMPDFSQRVGSGFGGGINISDATVYLVVLEEWATGSDNFGMTISLAVNELIYNGTTSN
ncbi:uncharacterized protein BT62DRAFT_540325 [Guyanagaster necrorhizus]|uniref:Uncharacterized protein n=1 Tax=Guyanagaster necrorhizus TaxID=856835 RepID=A0A9P8AX53_9AGAR|nr:uncharacterized protein BT62DRAFT_540325 [Guyanagaster necrorhizus MCA 3950]KAG7450846.1 hypothetical protein BT62DRAFT_540325 [Guyanagaster necrorhizus MCA 3950]